jgi:hypothetical protein
MIKNMIYTVSCDRCASIIESENILSAVSEVNFCALCDLDLYPEDFQDTVRPTIPEIRYYAIDEEIMWLEDLRIYA